MNHLSPAEFVDLIDGRLGGPRARHAAECRECGERSAMLREAMAEAAGAPLPEPSPLFWTHFRARVSDAVRDEPMPVRTGMWSPWLARPAISIAFAVAVVALVTLAALRSHPALTPRENSLQIGATAPDAFWTEDADEGDEAWALVRAASEDIEWEEAAEAGIALTPGAAARVADQLTDAERAELARLIEDEIKRTGA